MALRLPLRNLLVIRDRVASSLPLLENLISKSVMSGGLNQVSPLLQHQHGSIRHLKNWSTPPQYDEVEFPERRKLKFVDRVPTYASGLRPPKMQRRLIFSRGPELIHNKFVHEQYGIVAKSPGRLRYGHFEMIRMTLARKIDQTRMFAVWRVDPPWQPVTRKGQGKRMGSGKPAIDHYVTPVKADRVIVELGGTCEFEEMKPLVREVVENLPFKAVFQSHQGMVEEEEERKRLAGANLNPYTAEYVIRNAMGMTRKWISPFDRMWYFKHT